VSGLRGLPEAIMVTTATVLIVAADIPNQKVGGRTAGMSGMVPCIHGKSQQRIGVKLMWDCNVFGVRHSA
jgi:hypothetical protein